MSDHNHEALQEGLEKRGDRQSKRPKMKVSGSQVRKLQAIIKAKAPKK